MSVGVQSRSPVARRSKRYTVTGSAVFQSLGGDSRGALLNFGKGGILARTDTTHPWGTKLNLHVHVAGYPETFAIRAQVVRVNEHLVAIKFLAEPEGIAFLIDWLDLQHRAVSGVVRRHSLFPAESRR